MVGGTVTIAEFLLARIAEDERQAEGAGKLAWLTFRNSDGSMRYTAAASSGQDPHDAIWVVDGREVTTESNTVQVMYDETRIRAECQAKRQIVEHYQRWQPTLYRNGGPKYDAVQETMYRMAMRWVLERLALPYVNHPDYQEWLVAR